MSRHFWTRNTAIIILGFLLVLSVVLVVVGALIKPLSIVTSIVLATINAATVFIAVIIPPSLKKEARRKTEEAINQYVLLQDASEHQRNIVINRMRKQAPVARYSWEEIAAYLQSLNEGERYAGLASVQWQWPNREVDAAMNFSHEEISPSAKRQDKDTRYFPQLLDILCNPARKFEHYHTIVAMWSMSYHLGPEQMQKLCERVISCKPYWESDKWGVFKNHLEEKC